MSTGAAATTAPLPNGDDNDGRYTLGHYYGSTKKVKVPELDHNARRRQRVIAEIVEAGRRLGIKEDVIRTNLDKMEALLPELTPDVNKMRAAEWAKLARDVNQVAMMLVVIKTSYPGANVGKIVSRAPKTLLQSPEQLQADAAVVRKVLAGAPNADAIIEEVPYLMSPPALAQSLSNVSRWYNTKDPVAMISKNPKLLLNVEEADLEADPLYGLSLNLSTIDTWDFGLQKVGGDGDGGEAATAAPAPAQPQPQPA
ncbi:hypothetical protein HYH02_012318 [Chlamydomonas schloesseri]|uniref:Uncharacterized protein n=1 Tax=Chlamydomonas schloesseri TaxID=2026947 RepID=A0A835T8R9_9CHLO|nr:hypothetical protein HYH02_012318 [Chlamydomonas schloesseri]|eukprot:KAG2434490.1 hypothetical protein HYH02_012318 [Chlamydomonas schloesseri]